MTKIVDTQGLPCPEPVMLTGKALEASDEVTCIVDNEVAKENVSRMAASKGFRVRAEEKGGLTHLHLTREATGTKAVSSGPVSQGPIVLLLASDAIGRGSDELGQTIMRTFLHTLGEMEPIPRKILFMNSGVKLVAEGSAVLDDLRALEKRGAELLACGTCLGYYEIKDKVAVGRISNMYDIASALLGAGKVIEL